jgi:hypothetical protein
LARNRKGKEEMWEFKDLRNERKIIIQVQKGVPDKIGRTFGHG